MPGQPREMITMAERRYPVRIRIGVPPGGFGQRHTEITGSRVVRIDHDANGLHAHLDSGETLDVDIIISATGVRPNTGFLAESGIATGTGILVDDRMQTNVADVFAAGDCTEAVEFATGKRIINAIQLNAVDQARIAALNMAGRSTRSQGAMALNVLDTFGLISASFGQWQGLREAITQNSVTRPHSNI